MIVILFFMFGQQARLLEKKDMRDLTCMLNIYEKVNSLNLLDLLPRRPRLKIDVFFPPLARLHSSIHYLFHLSRTVPLTNYFVDSLQIMDIP